MKGYTVKLFFLSLQNVEEAIFRVRHRVAQGGYHISDEVVRRRFAAGLSNFQNIYCREVNFWRKYDNSGVLPVVIDEGRNL